MDVKFACLEKMLAVWNCTDAAEQRTLTDAALEHNVHFVDPNHNIIGRDAFLNMVALVQKKLPGAVYSRTSRIEMHNNHCRYHWAIHHNGALLLHGFDVSEVNDLGKIVKVIGFFGDFPRDEAG